MKKLTNMMLVTGGALLLGAGAVTNYLLAQQPQTAQEELTLSNLEAMAFIDPEDPDNPDLNSGGGGKIDCYGVLVNAGAGYITVTKCSTCLDETCTDYSQLAKCRK